MVEVGDDLPCKLCEQLVGHLKDLLVANTTEIEFKEVLLGLCKQTKSFADEVCILNKYVLFHISSNNKDNFSSVKP